MGCNPKSMDYEDKLNHILYICSDYAETLWGGDISKVNFSNFLMNSQPYNLINVVCGGDQILNKKQFYLVQYL